MAAVKHARRTPPARPFEPAPDAFIASGQAVAVYFREMATGQRESTSLKRGVGVWFSYLIGHEAHHRGSILLTLKQTGHALDESTRWGLWAWDKI